VRIGPAELAHYAAALHRDRRLLALLRWQRCWTPGTIAQLGLGADRGRIVIPVHDHGGELVAVLRYNPRAERRGPKLIAQPGSRRTLYPAPETIAAGELVVVEGEPDAIAAHSAGLPAIAVPGSGGWRPHWAARFVGRDVLVVADADLDGRRLARTIVAQLHHAGVGARAIDLHPDRHDGADLTNWLRARRHQAPSMGDLVAAGVALPEDDQ